MSNSSAAAGVRPCGTPTMRLGSGIQHLSPGFSSEENVLPGAGTSRADAGCVAEREGTTLGGPEESRWSGKWASHDARLRKPNGETEEDPDDEIDDELIALSIDEAVSAVFNVAAGRSLPQQAREALVRLPATQSSVSSCSSDACGDTTAAGVAGGGVTTTAAGTSPSKAGVAASRPLRASVEGDRPRLVQQGVADTSGNFNSENDHFSRNQTPEETLHVYASSSPSLNSASDRSGNEHVRSSNSEPRGPSPPLSTSRGTSNNEQRGPLRRLLWMRLLGVLRDADPLQWAQQLQHQRAAYVRLQEEEERQLSAKRLTSLDPQLFHPLAATADNPWSQRQQNEALLLEIWKDVERTLAERRLFRSNTTRKALQRILFTWSRKNPEVSYKQGMNELLAIFYLVCYRGSLFQAHGNTGASGSTPGSSSSSRKSEPATKSDGFSSSTNYNGSSGSSRGRTSTATTTAAEERQHHLRRQREDGEVAVQVLLASDLAAVEADSFVLFDAVMNRFMLKAAYLPAPSATVAAASTGAAGAIGIGTSLLHRGSSCSSGRLLGGGPASRIGSGLLPPDGVTRSSMVSASKSALLWRCSYIFDTLLPVADRPLYEHLKTEEVEPQLFLLRWMRLLFSREFHIEDTLLLWDALFADAYLHEAIEQGGHAFLTYNCKSSAAAVRQSPVTTSPRIVTRATAEPGSKTPPALASAVTAAIPTSAGGEPKAIRCGDTSSGVILEQQPQKQSRVPEMSDTMDCSSFLHDPFQSLLRISSATTIATSGTTATEVMYDAEQVGAASAAKLPLVDYFVLAMLKYVRSTLMESNQILCLRRLLRFPPTESIQPLVLLAISLRSRRLPYPGRVSANVSATGPSQSLIATSGDGLTAPSPFPSIFNTQQRQQQRYPQYQNDGKRQQQQQAEDHPNHQQQEQQQQQQLHGQERQQLRQRQLLQQQQHLRQPFFHTTEQQHQHQYQQEKNVTLALACAGTKETHIDGTAEHPKVERDSLITRSNMQCAHGHCTTESSLAAPCEATPPQPQNEVAASPTVLASSSISFSPLKREACTIPLNTNKREEFLSMAHSPWSATQQFGDLSSSQSATAATTGGQGEGGFSHDPFVPTHADVNNNWTTSIATSNSSSSDDITGAKNQRCTAPRIVNVDIGPSSAAAGRRATPTAAEAGGAKSSSVSASSQEGSERALCAGDGASDTVAGRTISKHVEEVAADICAALALWSSKEFLAHMSNSRGDVLKISETVEMKAVQQTFISYARRMQAAEERIAAALVRLQLLHRVLDGDIAYSSSLFPPVPAAARCSSNNFDTPLAEDGAALERGRTAMAGTVKEGATEAASSHAVGSSSSRNEYVDENLGEEPVGTAAAPATVR